MCLCLFLEVLLQGGVLSLRNGNAISIVCFIKKRMTCTSHLSLLNLKASGVIVDAVHLIDVCFLRYVSSKEVTSL